MTNDVPDGWGPFRFGMTVQEARSAAPEYEIKRCKYRNHKQCLEGTDSVFGVKARMHALIDDKTGLIAGIALGVDRFPAGTTKTCPEAASLILSTLQELHGVEDRGHVRQKAGTRVYEWRLDDLTILEFAGTCHFPRRGELTLNLRRLVRSLADPSSAPTRTLWPFLEEASEIGKTAEEVLARRPEFTREACNYHGITSCLIRHDEGFGKRVEVVAQIDDTTSVVRQIVIRFTEPERKRDKPLGLQGPSCELTADWAVRKLRETHGPEASSNSVPRLRTYDWNLPDALNMMLLTTCFPTGGTVNLTLSKEEHGNSESD